MKDKLQKLGKDEELIDRIWADRNQQLQHAYELQVPVIQLSEFKYIQGPIFVDFSGSVWRNFVDLLLHMKIKPPYIFMSIKEERFNTGK